MAELVVREITGERLSIAEDQQVKAWLENNPARARMLACLRDAQWRMQEWQRYKDVDKQAIWTRMQARAATMPEQLPLPALEHRSWVGNPAGKSRTIRIWAMIAALILYHSH
ncbi:hypothetical protein [Puia dinghuensis]|uniref:hypothetical protein n=1 Tax=Puia dinghuensis TaxID=1792502 RepID=UPI00166C4FED|nr:hypothetical protein [Puia dinghuensis]